MRLRYHLASHLVAALLPMIVFAALVMIAFGRQQRAGVERGAVETARALVKPVDPGEFTVIVASLAEARAM